MSVEHAVAMAEGAALLLGGAGIGATWMAVRSKRPRPTQQPRPFCGCGHHLSMHDPFTKACSAVEREDYWEFGVNKLNEFPCDCKQYIGPEPVASFFVPEIRADGS